MACHMAVVCSPPFSAVQLPSAIVVPVRTIKCSFDHVRTLSAKGPAPYLLRLLLKVPRCQCIQTSDRSSLQVSRQFSDSHISAFSVRAHITPQNVPVRLRALIELLGYNASLAYTVIVEPISRT